MTIKDFLDKLKKNDEKFHNLDGLKLSDVMAECTSIWDNDACRGYLIATAKYLKMTKEEIEKMLKIMRYMFSEYSVEEAAKIYIEF